MVKSIFTLDVAGYQTVYDRYTIKPMVNSFRRRFLNRKIRIKHKIKYKTTILETNIHTSHLLLECRAQTKIDRELARDHIGPAELKIVTGPRKLRIWNFFQMGYVGERACHHLRVDLSPFEKNSLLHLQRRVRLRRQIRAANKIRDCVLKYLYKPGNISYQRCQQNYHKKLLFLMFNILQSGG